VWELTIQPRPKIKTGQSARVVVVYGSETHIVRIAIFDIIRGTFAGRVRNRDR
jgi:hypothetical protein